MKILFCLLLWGTISSGVYAQRVLPAKSKEQKRTEKQIEKKENSQIKLTDEALFATKLFGVCLTINGSIKVRVRELEAKLK